MSRLPGDDVAAALCEAAHRDIDRIAALWPAVRDGIWGGVDFADRSAVEAAA